VLRCTRRHTHQSNPDLGFLSGVPLEGRESGVDGVRTANRQFAVAAAGWEPVGGAWALGPGGRQHCKDRQEAV
jgi:hypothetical protein